MEIQGWLWNNNTKKVDGSIGKIGIFAHDG